MASRNFVYESLTLRSRESPGGSRVLTLMTAEAGIVDAFVFGGPKSKLRSLASPFAAGRAFVYLDPVKDYRKLTDFEPHESFPCLREDLGRLWGATLVAELLIRTSGGGGDFPLVLELANSCLSALDREAPGASLGPALLFIWRLVNMLGLGPDPSACASCGSELRPRRGGPEPAAAYSPEHEAFLCPECAGRERGAFELGQGALYWLGRSLELEFEEAAALPLLPETSAALKGLLFRLARKAAEGPVASLEPGALPA